MKRKYILYVDDDELPVLLTAGILRQFGHRIQGITQWKNAIVIFQRKSAAFDLVVADMYMPGITGIELAMQLRQIRPNVRIVLCTGRLTDEVKVQAQNAGIEEVVSKPDSPQHLAAAIHQLVMIHQSFPLIRLS